MAMGFLDVSNACDSATSWIYSNPVVKAFLFTTNNTKNVREEVTIRCLSPS